MFNLNKRMEGVMNKEQLNKYFIEEFRISEVLSSSNLNNNRIILSPFSFDKEKNTYFFNKRNYHFDLFNNISILVTDKPYLGTEENDLSIPLKKLQEKIFPTGISSFFEKEEFIYFIIINEKRKERSAWEAKQIVSFCYQKEKKSLSGFFINKGIYNEDGKTEILYSEWCDELFLDDIMQVFEIIKKKWKIFFSGFDKTYTKTVDLGLKHLRKQLPITKKILNWEHFC